MSALIISHPIKLSNQVFIRLIQINPTDIMNEYPNSTSILVIGDSHLRYSHSYFAKSSFNIIVKAIRGLKWVDYFDENLSVFSLLLSSEIQSILISTKAVFFLVSINSLRIKPAKKLLMK